MAGIAKYAGIYLATKRGQSFTWPRQGGPYSPRVELLVDSRTDNELQRLGVGPFPLEFQGQFSPRNSADFSSSFTHSGVYLGERLGGRDTMQVSWWLYDIRQWFRFVDVDCNLNETRPLNETQDYFSGAIGFFNRVRKIGYNSGTMATGDKLAPSFGDPDSEPQGLRPWTAFQFCMYLLTTWMKENKDIVKPTGYGGIWPPKVILDPQSKPTDNGVTMSTARIKKPWPKVFRKYAREAFIDIDWDPQNSQFIVYSRQPTSIPDEYGNYIGHGTKVRANFQRTAPRAVNVKMRRQIEARFNYVEPTNELATRTPRNTALELEQVLSLPQDITDPDTGILYRAQTYVPLETAFRLYNNDQNYPVPKRIDNNGNSSTLTFGYDLLRRYSKNKSLANVVLYDPLQTEISRQIYSARVASLYSSYRRLFRIPVFWLELIEDLQANRVAVIDPLTRKATPSPVYLDHFVQWSRRSFRLNTIANPKMISGQNNYAWPGPLQDRSDIGNLALADGIPSKYHSIRIENKAQGIIEVVDVLDPFDKVGQTWPATFDKIPQTAFSRGGIAVNTLDEIRYEDQFRLATILSLRLKTPNSRNKFFIRRFESGKENKDQPPAIINGALKPVVLRGSRLGPEVDVTNEAMPVLEEWIDGQSRVIPIRGGPGVEISGNEIVNKNQIADVCKAAIEDVNFSTQDATYGRFGSPGYNNASDRPNGQLSAFVVRYTDGGKLETFVDATQPIRSPSIKEALSPETLQYIFRIGANEIV